MIRKLSQRALKFTSGNIKIEASYDIKEEIGSGGFSVVKRGIHKESGDECALKMIRTAVFKKNKERTEEEVAVLGKLNHPNIVQLKEVIKTNKYFVIVMELLRGGELFERILQREKYSEHDARAVASKILMTLQYLHDNNVVHRDLKPENFMFDKPGDDGELKLTDFGFATALSGRKKLTASCGTPEYVAPEILEEKPYGAAVDMWSAGVIIYILLCGFPPFYGDTEGELFDRICNGEYQFLAPYWNDVSFEAKDLIRHLLEINPRKRYTAAQALQHRWFAQQSNAPQADLSSALHELKRYQATRKFRKAVLAVIAGNKLKVILKSIQDGAQ